MNKAAAKLRKLLIQKFSDQFELDVGAENLVLLTLVSEKFQNQTRNQRLQQIEPIIQELGLTPSILELYTPTEAQNENLNLRNTTENFSPTSWKEAIDMLSSGKTITTKEHQHPIKRVVFYSYKGGVGRTTALIQTAFQLTRAGKRVALVDMDVEAPGLQALLPPTDTPLEEGLIDYLWERQTVFFDSQHPPQIHLTGSHQGQRRGIVYSMTDPATNKPLFVIPAGKIAQRYIQRLSVLNTSQLFASSKSPWSQFEQALWEQIQPDMMLIDARTGLNEWGGLSLLRLADETFITLYPSTQDIDGVCLIREILEKLGCKRPKLVLSLVPEGMSGTSLVEKMESNLMLDKDEKTIKIPYYPNLIGHHPFPVETALADYEPLIEALL